jgi:tetraacyldisaccharide-1-P 4'-kinase
VVEVSFKSTLLQWRGNPAPLNFLKGQTAVALSAIGNPAAFEEELKRMGAVRVIPRRFSDHRVFSDHDLSDIESHAEREHAVIVTTEKDFVKLRETRWANDRFAPSHVYVLRQETTVDDTLGPLIHQALHEKN